MRKPNKTSERKNVLGVLAGLSVFVVSPVAFAVTADDVVCTECVETSDLAPGAVGTSSLKNGAVGTNQLKNGAVGTFKLKNAAVTTDKLQNNAVGTYKLKNGAVTTEKLRNGAVGTGKLKNGAVTYDKLATDLKAVMDDALVYDYRDYGFQGTDSHTHAVYAISGRGLWDCGGVGTVDTEVREIVRTALPDGSYHIEYTNRPYTGGAGGTPCNISVDDYIADAHGLKLVRHRNYEADGITVSNDVSTTYDINDAPSAGLMFLASDMKLGIDFLSSGLTTQVGDPDDGMYFSEGVLTNVEVTATIDAGGPNEEVVQNCIMVRESRLSNHLGYAERVRTMCPGVGMVNLLKGEPNSGKTRHYQLIEYSTAP